MEGLGYGAAAYLSGTNNFSNNAGELRFSGNELKIATVGCGAALFLTGGSNTTITGQHRDDNAGVEASISLQITALKVSTTMVLPSTKTCMPMAALYVWG